MDLDAVTPMLSSNDKSDKPPGLGKTGSPHRTPRIKNFAVNLGLFLASSVVCILISELVFAEFYDTNNYRISDHLFDPVVGWRTKPGVYLLKPPHSFSKHEMYINRHGLRNREIDERQEGVRRLMILGDSFTMGRAVREEELFSSLLEHQLNGGSQRRYEVVNAGVPGYGTAQEFLLMKELADDGVIADAYLLVIFVNDILDNQRLTYGDLNENPVQPGFVLDEKGGMVLQYQPQYREFKSSEFVSSRRSMFRILSILRVKIEAYLQTEPALVDFARTLGLQVEIPRVPGILNAWYRPDLRKNGVPLMKGLIREVRDQAHRYNASLSVALVPSPLMVYGDTYGPMLERSFPDDVSVHEFRSDPLRPHSTVGTICQELNIPFVDLYPPFMEFRDQSIFIPEEGHLSSYGHSLAGRTLARFVGELDSLHSEK